MSLYQARFLCVALATLAVLPSIGLSQNSDPVNVVPNVGAPVLNGTTGYIPLTAADKFNVAWKDAISWRTGVLALGVAGRDQLRNANPSYGQGAAGFARSFGSDAGDLVISDLLSDAVFPTVFHQDPRYYRKETGTGWARFRHAILQVVETRGDNGSPQFNFSQLAGEATTVLISNSYNSDHRNAVDASQRFGLRIAADCAINLVKEFGPNAARMFSRKTP